MKKQNCFSQKMVITVIFSGMLLLTGSCKQAAPVEEQVQPGPAFQQKLKPPKVEMNYTAIKKTILPLLTENGTMLPLLLFFPVVY